MACDMQEQINTAIREYLEKNLTINVKVDENIDYYSKGIMVSVEVLVENQVISEATDHITTSSSY